VTLRLRVCLQAGFLGAFAFISPANGGLIINPTFDASITADANSAVIEGAINQAIAPYQTMFADPVNVSILFRYSANGPDGSALPGGRLAQSNYTQYSIVFNTFITRLIADATTANDAIAVATLPTTNLASRIDPSSANGRAVGLNTPGAMSANASFGTGGTLDGIVTLNAGQPLQFDRTGGISAGNYDARRLIEHEIDEVLGLGSGLPFSTDFTGNTARRPQDLFRYHFPDERSFSSSAAATSYLSIDGGVTKIVDFNQDSGGDYGDWLSPSCSPLPAPLVQYAFTCPGQAADISFNSPEAINLDVIGYDLSASESTPEPASILLVMAGIALLATLKRQSCERRTK
jgi:hypothetical protein